MENIEETITVLPKTQEEQTEGKNVHGRIEQWIRIRCMSVQMKIEKLSAVTKLVLLALFLLMGFFYNLHVIVDSLSPKNEKTGFKINSIPAPINVITQGNSINTTEFNSSDQDKQKILKFLFTLDSLKKSPEGLIQYHKYIRANPGLIDSIKQAEKMYVLSRKP